MEDNAALYDEILKNGPSQATLHVVLTRIKNEGRVNEVIKWCLAFVRVYPKDVYLRTLLGESYLAMGLMGQAEAEFLKVVSLMDDLLPAHARLAEIYAKQKRFSEAAGEAALFLAHHPEDAKMRELLQTLETSEATTKARDQQWPVPPEDDAASVVAFATPTIAELYFTQGQLDVAVEIYERVVAEHPDDSASAKRLSQLKESLKASLPDDGKASGGADAEQEKLLTILERWLPRVGEIKYG